MLALAACAPVRADVEPRSTGAIEAVLPHNEGPFHPSLSDHVADVDVSSLVDVQTCGGCHAEVAAQWDGSAHAYASFANPWYRVSVDRLHDAVGPEATQFCGGCHDPGPLFDGAMTAQVGPDHPGAHVGVTCVTCHTAVDATSDGNGSYTLAGGDVPLPRDGDDASLARHIAAMRPAPLDDGSLCIACHRGALGAEVGNVHHLTGVEDVGAWSDSAWAGRPFAHLDEPVETRGCVSCHMAQEAGVASHRFAGGHTALAAALGNDEQLAAQRAMLRGAASVVVAAASVDGAPAQAPATSVAPQAGASLVLDLVVRNEGVGHRFPGGTLDLQDVWLQVELRDATGRLLAQSGAAHAADAGDDAWVARAVLVDADGAPVTTHDTWRFVALVSDRTVAPRDVRLVRYAATLPPDTVGPVRADVRLLHRSRSLALREAACAAQRSARGQAFAAALIEARGAVLDACGDAPITEVASASAVLDGQGRGHDARAQWLWGRALATDVQEALPAARTALTRAIEMAADERADDVLAYATAELARVEGRAGRTEQALRLWRAAELLRPTHPAPAYGRGDALARVWRWDEAAAAYGEALRRADGSTSAWRSYAVALASAGRYDEALAAAQSGLRLQPRDEGLLRAQSRALDALQAGDVARAGAAEAFARFRAWGGAWGAVDACVAQHPVCVDTRVPVPVVPLTPAP